MLRSYCMHMAYNGPTTSWAGFHVCKEHAGLVTGLETTHVVAGDRVVRVLPLLQRMHPSPIPVYLTDRDCMYNGAAARAYVHEWTPAQPCMGTGTAMRARTHIHGVIEMGVGARSHAYVRDSLCPVR